MQTILIKIFFTFSFLISTWFSSSTNHLSYYHSHLPSDSLTTITLAFVGDLMCHSTQFNYANVSKDSFDFRPVFREVKKQLVSADFTIGNLETVLGGKDRRYSGYPMFNSPDEYLTALKHTGFDLLFTSNNHSLDRGEKGILRTIDQINQNKLNYVGTYSSQEDRDSIRIYNLKGIKTAFLSYSYGTNGNPIPKEKDYLINLIDINLVERDIQKAKELLSDVIIVYYHFGNEYKTKPSAYQIEIVKKTIEFGADIIIGSHPHVLQPIEYFKTMNAKIDTGIVAYSLGNFISNQRWRYSDAGVILNLSISKNELSSEIKISNVDYIPTWVFRGETENGKEFIILPSEESLADSTKYYLSNSDKVKIRQSINDTHSILNLKNSQKNLKNNSIESAK